MRRTAGCRLSACSRPRRTRRGALDISRTWVRLGLMVLTHTSISMMHIYVCRKPRMERFPIYSESSLQFQLVLDQHLGELEFDSVGVFADSKHKCDLLVCLS